MARIRTIKPEFPQSESMGRLSRDARLLFVQLWTIVDDDGKARAASRLLASLLYPYDDDAPELIDGWLAELQGEGCITRYIVGGTSYLQVCKWAEHQKIDRPSVSKLPDPPPVTAAASGDSTDTREDSRAFDAGPRTVDLVPSTNSAQSATPTARDFAGPKWEPFYDAVLLCGLDARKANGKPSALSGKLAGAFGPPAGDDPASAASMLLAFWASPDAQFFTARDPLTSVAKWLRKQPARANSSGAGYDPRFYVQRDDGRYVLKDPSLVEFPAPYAAHNPATWPPDMRAAYVARIHQTANGEVFA